MNALTNRVPSRGVLHVRVGEDVHANLARAREAMEALQQGRRAKAHFAVGFAEVGQMLAVFTPKRWELIAKLREIGPVTTAQLARTLERDYKNVHADVGALSEWLAVQRDEPTASRRGTPACPVRAAPDVLERPVLARN